MNESLIIEDLNVIEKCRKVCRMYGDLLGGEFDTSRETHPAMQVTEGHWIHLYDDEWMTILADDFTQSMDVTLKAAHNQSSHCDNPVIMVKPGDEVIRCHGEYHWLDTRLNELLASCRCGSKEPFEVATFKKGESVWTTEIGGLVVRCTIEEVDDNFNKKDPHSYFFYSLDEPIGHYPGKEELFRTLREVRKALLNERGPRKVKRGPYKNLEDFREHAKKFIASTWTNNGHGEPNFPEYAKKEHGKDWFHITELMDHLPKDVL